MGRRTRNPTRTILHSQPKRLPRDAIAFELSKRKERRDGNAKKSMDVTLPHVVRNQNRRNERNIRLRSGCAEPRMTVRAPCAAHSAKRTSGRDTDAQGAPQGSAAVVCAEEDHMATSQAQCKLSAKWSLATSAILGKSPRNSTQGVDFGLVRRRPQRDDVTVGGRRRRSCGTGSAAPRAGGKRRMGLHLPVDRTVTQAPKRKISARRRLPRPFRLARPPLATYSPLALPFLDVSRISTAPPRVASPPRLACYNSPTGSALGSALGSSKAPSLNCNERSSLQIASLLCTACSRGPSLKCSERSSLLRCVSGVRVQGVAAVRAIRFGVSVRD
jgi:hypothetical protein